MTPYQPINLDTPPPCPHCGGALTETHHHAETWEHGSAPEAWTYTCTGDGCMAEYHERPERLTMRTAPWTRALAAEVARWRGGATAGGRTAYQRGNRDAMLQFAHVAAQRAEAHRAEVARCDAVMAAPDNAVQANAARQLYATALWRMQAWQDAAALAERMAEAMPEDPESPEEEG